MAIARVNRRRFLGCSAAAGLAFTQGELAEAAAASDPVRLGLIGAGGRGTALIRALVEIPGVQITAVCDPVDRHRDRALGVIEKAAGARPAGLDDYRHLLDRADVDAVAIALPCDLHEPMNLAALAAGKHVYAEKPLGLSLPECDRLIAMADAHRGLVVHVGFQRRSNPRFREGVERIRQGELGALIEARASWTSGNGPLMGHDGWLARRARSGDWMVEQAVHIWDVLLWLKGSPPESAVGWGRRDLFAALDPGRDVTDHYSVELQWADGFRASFVQSWVAPADQAFTGSTLRVMGEAGGLDFGSGSLTFRDRGRPRETLRPGIHPDTRLALAAFIEAIHDGSRATPITLAQARLATKVGLMARQAVDLGRRVSFAECEA